MHCFHVVTAVMTMGFVVASALVAEGGAGTQHNAHRARTQQGDDDLLLLSTYRLEPLLMDLSIPQGRDGDAEVADDGARKNTRGAGGGEDALEFWSLCWERRPCLLRKEPREAAPQHNGEDGSATPQHRHFIGGLSGLRDILSHTSGSWLMEELSASKRSACRDDPHHASGCSWRDDKTVLPASYFDGPRGQASLQSIRGTASVQDDVVIGDTMSKTVAEQALLEYLRGRRGITRTRSFVGEAAKVSGEEWIAFAQDTNQTLILRDADGRSPTLQAVAATVRGWFMSPDEGPSPYKKDDTDDTDADGIVGGGMDVGISLYYTPPNRTSTVPPHIDTMDVLIIQETGHKRWTLSVPEARYFLPMEPVRLPLTQAHYGRRRMAKATDDSGSTSSSGGGGGNRRYYRQQDVVVGPGDVLYVPRGVIHNTSTVLTTQRLTDVAAAAAAREGAASVEDGGSLHISIGLETDPSFTVSSFLLFASHYAAFLETTTTTGNTLRHGTASNGASLASCSSEEDSSSPCSGGGDDIVSRDDARRRLRVYLEEALWPAASEVDRSWSKRDRDLLLLCVARALLHHASRRIIPLRRSIAVPILLCNESNVKGEGKEGRGRGRCMAGYVRNAVDRARSAVTTTFGGEGAAGTGAAGRDGGTARRWRLLIQDAFGSASNLRGTSDIWWPRSADEEQRSSDDDDVGELQHRRTSPLLCGFDGARNDRRKMSSPRLAPTKDMAQVIEFMSNVVLDALHRVMTERVVPATRAAKPSEKTVVEVGSWMNLLDATMLWLLPASNAPARYLSCLWSEWMAEGLQEGHEARIAFQDWSWVNGVLLDSRG